MLRVGEVFSSTLEHIWMAINVTCDIQHPIFELAVGCVAKMVPWGDGD
jgi:hypothetical protein